MFPPSRPRTPQCPLGINRNSKAAANPADPFGFPRRVQMAKMDWQRNKHTGRPRETAFTPPPAKTGCWSHIKREEVKTFTADEIAAWQNAMNGGAQ